MYEITYTRRSNWEGITKVKWRAETRGLPRGFPRGARSGEWGGGRGVESGGECDGGRRVDPGTIHKPELESIDLNITARHKLKEAGSSYQGHTWQ